MGIARGGGETFDLNMARALKQLGCDIHVVAGRRLNRLDRPVSGIDTTYIATPYLRWIMYWADGQNSRLSKMIGRYAAQVDQNVFINAAFRRIVKTDLRDSDIFQLCGQPQLACRLEESLRGRAVVWWPGPPGPILARWRGRFSANFANGDALFDARKFDPDTWEIPLGVYVNTFHPGDGRVKRKEMGISDADVVVLFVGRLIPIKGLPFLMAGFAYASRRVSNLKLVFIGDGTERERLKRQAADLKISDRVVFAGEQASSAVAEFYRAADIFALTSIYDNLPNVVLEAMASGLPVVATNVGGIPTQVEDGVNGYLVNSGDVKALSEAFCKLALSANLRKLIGKTNFEKVDQRYDWMVSAQTLRKLYYHVLKGAKTSYQQ
jgi:glycosyltransferase involved in cell wall biosynthesis